MYARAAPPTTASVTRYVRSRCKERAERDAAACPCIEQHLEHERRQQDRHEHDALRTDRHRKPDRDDRKHLPHRRRMLERECGEQHRQEERGQERALGHDQVRVEGGRQQEEEQRPPRARSIGRTSLRAQRKNGTAANVISRTLMTFASV